MRREQEIDIAKGIAIICVVIGHSYTSWNSITQLINSFHMPFFFIVTGILYRLQYEKIGHCKFDIKSKMRTLMVPWIIWGGAYQLFLCCLQVIGGASISQRMKVFVEQFLELSFGSTWFLPALFIATTLFVGTARYKTINISISIICLFLGLYVPECVGIMNSVCRALLGCTFISIGYYGFSMFYQNDNPKVLALIFVIVIYTCISFYNGVVAMYARIFGSMPLLFLFTGILGSYILLKISKYLKKVENNKAIDALSLLGRKSIIVLCLHNFFIEIIKLIDYKFFSDWLVTLGIFEGILLSSIVLIFVISLFPVCDRFLGFTFGRRER